MGTLREKIQWFIKTISSRVEETAYNELPAHVIAMCGAIAGALATLVLLAVAHLGDVIVLRHHYAFLIGYVATVFSATSLIILHSIVGAIAAYVHLRAEEYLNSGQWLAFACFFPLFGSTGTYIAERLTEIAWIGESPLAPPLRALIAIVATFAMTWLFWIPWLSFYRVWLARRTRLEQRLMSSDPRTPAHGRGWSDGQSGMQGHGFGLSDGDLSDSQSSDVLESSRSHMRIRRQIALIRKHRAGEINDMQLLDADLFDDLSKLMTQASADQSEGVGSTPRRKRLARRLPVVGLVALTVILIGGTLYNSLLPDGIRGASVKEGAARGNQPIRLIIKSPSLGTELVRAVASEVTGGSEDGSWVDVIDISQFSMFALRTIMSDGRSGIVISTRQDLMEMDRLGMLVDLKPLLQRDQIDLLTFVDSAVAELSSGDTVFGLPLTTSPLLLYVNTEAMSHTDLVPGVPPVLWSDLLDYAKALTWFTNSGETLVVSQLGFATSSSLWHAWLQLASSPILSRTGLESAAATSSSIPSAWMMLVDVASGLRATSLPDDAEYSRNPFYERPYDPVTLFASGQLAMVVADYSLHVALSSRYPDVQYGVANIPAPDWAASGVSISNGLGIGILRPDLGASQDAATLVEASWQIVKAIASDADIQARIAEHSGMLPGLKSLYSLPSGHQPQSRSLFVGNEDVKSKFYSSQLSASPATYIDLPTSSLSRLYRLLDRLTQGAESVPDVMEQIAVTLSNHAAQGR